MNLPVKITLTICSTVVVVVTFVAGMVVGCAPASSDGDGNDRHYDDHTLKGVAVQEYQDPRSGGKTCLVFTHDTGQGASMQVVC